MVRVRLFSLAAVCLWSCLGLAEEFFLAGWAPDVRPVNAPRLQTHAKDAAWYRCALTGVSTPYPHSLRFLESQGAWYTPFTQPGMTGPYDIRHWHAPAKEGVCQAGGWR